MKKKPSPKHRGRRRFLKASGIVATGVALAVIAPSSVHGANSSGRLISADLAQIQGPHSMTWQDCVGAGRVAEGLRSMWRQQLRECKDAIGFKYLRMHGLLEDELGVYSENKDGTPVYNWLYIDDVYDYLLSIGVKPFVELGFMPTKLAKRDDTIFWWKGNVTPPKDYPKWDALIGYQQNDPYSRYLEMGSPSDLTPKNIAELKSLSTGKPSSEKVVTVKGGAFTASLPQTENSVTLITLDPR